MTDLLSLKVVREDKEIFNYAIYYFKGALYDSIPYSNQAQATTLFVTAVANALFTNSITIDEAEELFTKYLASKFVIHPVKSPIVTLNLLQNENAGSYIFISRQEKAVLINYNIILMDQPSIAYSLVSIPTVVPGTIRVYTGTVEISDKITVLQSLQLQNDSDFTYTVLNPNNINYALAVKDRNNLELLTKLRVFLTLAFDYMALIAFKGFTVEQYKLWLKEQLADWTYEGNWFIFPETKEGPQYLVSFIGKVKHDEEWIPLAFSVKLLFGGVIFEYRTEVIGTPIYLGPLLTTSMSIFTNPDGSPVPTSNGLWLFVSLTTGVTLNPILPTRKSFKSKDPTEPGACNFCNIRIGPLEDIIIGGTDSTVSYTFAGCNGIIKLSMPGSPDITIPIDPVTTFQIFGSLLSLTSGQCDADSIETLIFYSEMSCDATILLSYQSDIVPSLTWPAPSLNEAFDCLKTSPATTFNVTSPLYTGISTLLSGCQELQFITQKFYQ